MSLPGFHVLALLLQAAATHVVTGVVRDPAGGVVPNAEVRLLGPQQRVAAAARTDARGQFRLALPETGSYVVEVRAPGFAEVRSSVRIPLGERQSLDLTTGTLVLHDEVSVTALIDHVESDTRLTQPVNIVDTSEIQQRVKSIVVEAVSEEAGLHVQRTSTVMAGVFVRGLTGNKVNVFVDGVRYSTAAQRGGVNTFLDLIDPSLLDSIEVLRGPNSAQYGSDALGGSLQFLSRVPSVGVQGPGRAGAMFSAGANSADRGAAINGSGSYTAPTLGIFAGGAARHVGELRTGGGIDSHAAVTRFLGVRSDVLMPAHLPDTGFDQYGAQATLDWTPSPGHRVVTSYRRGRQNGGARYDQLLGGDGNLVADLRDLTLDLGYARYETLEAGAFDHVSVTASVNSQHEERVNQGANGNPRAAINHEPERTTAYGIQGIARKQMTPRYGLVVGADFHPEHMTALSTGVNPVTGVSTVRRGRVPDGATYRAGGAFAQVIVDAVPSKVQIVGNARVNRASYRARAADSAVVNGQTLWPDDRLEATGAAFRAGVSAVLSG